MPQRTAGNLPLCQCSAHASCSLAASVANRISRSCQHCREEQKRLAEASKKKLAESGAFDRPIVTEIVPAGKFWPAEEYHQDYYRKNPVRYKFYRFNSGRDQFLEKKWGK